MKKGNALRLRALYICIGCLLWASTAYGQHNYNRYHIEVTFDPKTHTLKGISTVEYYNSSDQILHSIYFLLLLNQGQKNNPFLHEATNDQSYWNGFDPSWTRIESVSTAEGNQLPYALEKGPLLYPFRSYSLDETVLRVDLPHPLAPGSSVVIKIAFISKAAHRSDLYVLLSGYKLGVYNWLWFWYPRAIPAQELTNGRYLTSEKSYYPSSLPAAFHEVLLTLPKTFQVAAASDHQKVIREDSTWKTVRIYSDVPTRSAGFVLSRDFRHYLLKGEIPIEVYYRPGNERAARLMASYSSEILDHYRRHFGPYIYRRLVVVDGPDWGYGNSAGDALVFMSRSHFDERDLLVPGAFNRVSEFGLAHEIAHMWWPFGVGLDFNAELWISEGFADYFAFSYFEEKYGEFENNLYEPQHRELLGGLAGGLLEINMRRFRSLGYLQNIIRDRFDEALVKPVQNVEYLNALFFKTYMKSVLMLRALRGLLGREQMEIIVRAAYEKHLHQSMTTEDFRAVVEKVSGRDWQDFFQQWFYQDNPAPFVDYAVAGFQSHQRADGQFQTEIRLLRQGTGKMPVAVVAITEDGQKILQTWTGEEAHYKLTIESARPIQQVQLDPHELTPDVNRFNNFYPRKWQVRWGSRGLSLDTYQIAISPLGVTGSFRLDDHIWSLTLIPSEINFVANLGRRASLEGQLRANFFPSHPQDHRIFELPSHLDGELGFNWVQYEHPQIGLPGKLWEATNRWRLALIGRLALNADPSLIYAAIDYRRQEALRRHYALWVSLRQGLNLPFTRLTAGALMKIRLAPNIHLDWQAEVGLGWKLPQLLQFELQELQSFAATAGFPYRGDFKLQNKATVSFPLLRDVGYSVANLALLRRIDGRLWLIAGDTASTLERIGNWKAEVGVGVSLEISTLGGLISFNPVVGVTYSIAGGAQRWFTPYFELKLPFAH